MLQILEPLPMLKSWRILIGILLLQPLWMNDRPIVQQVNGEITWPLFAQEKLGDNYYRIQSDWQLWPLIPYTPDYADPEARGRMAPLSKSQDSWLFTHWLGTDVLGRDLLAGLISGLNFALLIGLLSMVPALIFGTFMGWAAGHFGNAGLRLARWQSLLILLLLILAVYFLSFAFYWLTVLTVGCMIAVSMLPAKNKKNVPVDTIISKLIELLQSIPGLMLVILLGALTGREWYQLSLLIASIAWTGFARYLRAECLRLRSEDFILSAKAIGQKDLQIGLKHYLPNLISSIRVLAAYGIAGAVFLESSITFLGIGLPDDAITWGSILALAKGNLSAWWMVLFPSLCLLGFIYTLHSMARKQQKPANSLIN